MIRKNRTIVALFLLLAGCATMKPPTITPQQIRACQRWMVSGRISIQQENLHQQANVVWKRNGEQYRFDVFGPLGIGHVVLDVDAHRACLLSNSHKDCAATPEKLMQKQLGWALPLKPLQNWLLGLPALHKGWHIDYSEYDRFSGAQLPKRIRITRIAPPLRAQLVIEQWKFCYD